MVQRRQRMWQHFVLYALGRGSPSCTSPIPQPEQNKGRVQIAPGFGGGELGRWGSMVQLTQFANKRNMDVGSRFALSNEQRNIAASRVRRILGEWHDDGHSLDSRARGEHWRGPSSLVAGFAVATCSQSIVPLHSGILGSAGNFRLQLLLTIVFLSKIPSNLRRVPVRHCVFFSQSC